MSSKTPEVHASNAPKDAKQQKLEGDLGKLKQKLLIYQAHKKSIPELQTTSEGASTTMVTFIQQNQTHDMLIHPATNNYVSKKPDPTCCVIL